MPNLKTTNIILIGPGGAGKSTIGKLLAKKLELTWLDLDTYRWKYYDELGYDADKAKEIRKEKGFAGVVTYWAPFTLHSLERVLEEHPAGYVISTGAGSVMYDTPEFIQRAKKVLEPFPFVVLLTPAEDVEISVRLCRERILAKEPEMIDRPGGPIAVNTRLIRRNAYREFAKITIYNADHTPEQTCDSILDEIGKQST